MSITYVGHAPGTPFDADKLAARGITIDTTSEKIGASVILTDGTNYLWVTLDEEKHIISAECYGLNDPDNIMDAIAWTMGVVMISEHTPGFWKLVHPEWNSPDDADSGSITAVKT